MKTAENTASAEKTIGTQLEDLFYLGVGICATAKEKFEELVDELKEQNPETRDKGEQIVNNFVDDTRTAAEKFTEDLKKSYADILVAATELFKGDKAKDEDGSDPEDVEDDDDLDDDDLDLDEEDDDDDLDYVDDEDDDADLEDEEFEDEDEEAANNSVKDVKDEFGKPVQHEAKPQAPEITPTNPEVSGSNVDGATGENPNRINPVM